MKQKLPDEQVKSWKQFQVLSTIMFLLNIIVAVFTFICYFFVHISPKNFWLAGFFTLSLPVILFFVHPAFILYWLVKRKFIRIFISLITIIAGFPLLQRTLTFHETETIPLGKKSFEVMSYNVQTFNQYFYYKKKNKTDAEKIYKYINESKAEIKCFQDFFQLEKSELFNSIKKISHSGEYYYYLDPRAHKVHTKRGYIGVAIFSKFPIIQKGEIFSSKQSVNKGIYVDVVNGKDTMRIINIHLQSNKIKPDSLFENTNYEEIKEEYLNSFDKLKYGFQIRGKQAEVLENEIINSPHPIILCGDFNDIPYGFVYQRIRQHLSNSFEEKGSGFGFTYNGKLPFLRIDNQFFDKKFKIYEFKTHFKIKYSDHFPITARYTLINHGK